MNIVFVESYPQAIYGQQRTMLSLVEASNKLGNNNVVVCTGEGTFPDVIRTKGEKVTILSYPSQLSVYGGKIYKYGLRQKLSLFYQLSKYIYKLYTWFKFNNPDIVFCNDMRGLLTMGVAARLAGVPVVIWDKLDKPHGILDYFQLPIANLNFIISDSVKTKYPTWQTKFFSNKIFKLYDGVDISRVVGAVNIRDQLGLSQSDFVVVVLASISFRKGHDRILNCLDKILHKIPNFKLILVGGIESSPEGKSYYDSLPNMDSEYVVHLGYRDDTVNIINSSDVLLLPSRNEGMPLVFGEAWALGKPVVSANIAGAKEVVKDDINGYLFDGDSSDSLVKALVKSTDSSFLDRVKKDGPLSADKYFNKNTQHALFFDKINLLLKDKKK